MYVLYNNNTLEKVQTLCVHVCVEFKGELLPGASPFQSAEIGTHSGPVLSPENPNVIS